MPQRRETPISICIGLFLRFNSLSPDDGTQTSSSLRRSSNCLPINPNIARKRLPSSESSTATSLGHSSSVSSGSHLGSLHANDENSPPGFNSQDSSSREPSSKAINLSTKSTGAVIKEEPLVIPNQSINSTHSSHADSPSPIDMTMGQSSFNAGKQRLLEVLRFFKTSSAVTVKEFKQKDSKLAFHAGKG